ncbi:MAG: hypothetical protein QGH94_01430, partial [Phycisphaerae bacterium]|nr:hypothetical protein [Phycisphaerae bacterium]
MTVGSGGTLTAQSGEISGITIGTAATTSNGTIAASDADTTLVGGALTILDNSTLIKAGDGTLQFTSIGAISATNAAIRLEAGTLSFQNAGAISVTNPTILVASDATIEADTTSTATFGALTINDGITLTVAGADGGTDFANLAAITPSESAAIAPNAGTTVTVGNALSLGDGATFISSGAGTTAFTGAPTLSGTTATIGSHGTLDLGGPLAITAAQTLNITGLATGAVKTSELQAPGATVAINFADGAALATPMFNDGAVAKQINLTGNGVLFLDSSASDTITAGASTFKVGPGATLRAYSDVVAAPSGPLGVGGSTVNLDGGTAQFRNAAVVRTPVTYDFESGDLTGWTIVPYSGGGTGDQFVGGKQPYSGEAGAQGTYTISTYRNEVGLGGDNLTGIIETDSFVIGEAGTISFQQAAGSHALSGDPDSPNANMVGIALERQVGVGDWEMVETATNTGNNWVWKFPSWDTTPYIGDTVRLRIYDTHPGGWGHTAVDDIQISSADVVTYGALAMGSIDFIVTQTSTLRAQTILAATFGDLTLTNGTLNITEAVGGTTFASLTPVAAAANVGIDSQSAVNFGNALTLGDGASITLNGEAYNFTGAPTLSGTSATIAADGAVDLDGALSIAGKTLNVNGGGSVSAMDLLASGATTINLSGGSTLNATGFNDGATPGSTVDLSGDGVLAINGSAGGTIAAADTTFNVGAGSTLRAAHAAAGPMGAGGTNLLLTGGTFRVDGESTGTYTFDQVEYAWYNDVNHDNMRKIDDGTDGNGTNGGLFSLVPTPEGSWPVQVQGKASWTTEVTHASISDTYVEMWSGNFHAPTTGDYTFYVHGDDNEILWMDLDLSGDFNWVDLNTNGILDSGEGDVVTSNDIPEGWNIPRTFTVSLEGGEVYPFAVAHSEGGGGDDFWFSLNGTPVNPGSAAQAGLWSTGPTVLEPINMLTTDIEVTADSTLRTATSTTADFGALTLTDGTLNIQTRSAGNVTSFTSLTPIAALATVGISSDATVNVGGALTLGNESSFTFTGDTINFTGDAVLSGGSATIGVNSTLNVGGALPIAAKTLNVAGDGTINTTELQTGGASAINFSGGATVNALAFTDGGAPGSILDVTGNGTLAIDGSAGGTITADNSTIVIGHDATVTAAYAPSGNLGPAGTTLQMDGGVFSTTGQVVDLASAQLIHYGYHINNDALALDLNNNGGLMGGGDPTNGPNYFGQAVLTAGPGGRGLDFDIDADFTATGAIGQNDDYSNMWLGYLEADETGNWGLRNGGDDDVGAIWIDLDRDGVFESSIPGLGTNRGEQISYEDGGNKLVALTAGERYMVAFLHREGGGGSRADFRFTAPSVGERIIKPSDPAQAGLWWDDAKSLAAIDMSTTNVEVNDDSNLIASTGATATFGELKLASGILDVSGADGGVIFNSINPAMVPDGAVTGIVSNDPLTLTGVLNVGDGVDLSLSTAPSGGIVLNDDAADGIALTMRTEGLVNWTNYSYAADAVSLVHAGPDTLQLLELGATDALLTTFTAQGGILEFSGFTPLGGSTADLIMAGGEVKISGAAGGPISLTAGLVVTKDSILDAVTDTTADFGALSFDDSGAGAMLTTSGATGSINFTSTTILTATGDIGFDTASDTKAGQLDFNSTGATIVKTGDADLILDGGAALGLVGGEGIDVRAGRLIVQASSNPMGVDTAVGINGGEVVLVSSAAGTPETFDNSVTSTGGTLTAGADGGANIGALTVTVGNATGNDVTLTSGDLLLQTTDDYTLNITGNVAGEGNMTIGAASTIVVQGTIGSALTPVGAVTIDGSLETKNAVTVNELVANAGGVYTATGAVKDLTVAQTLTLNSGIDLSGANVVLDGANVTVSNGVLAVGNNLGVATPVASVDVSKGGGLSLGGNSLKTQKLATTGGTFDMGATGSFVATGDVAITPAGGPAQLQLSGGTLSIQGPGGAMPTNLQMHLDAADSATLFQDAAGTIAAADGTSVALWQDKSGNGNDVSQTNGVLLPVYETSANTLNGESTVHFTADHLVRPNDIGTDGNKDRTVVTVWHNASGVMNYNHVLHMGANAGGQAYGHSISRGGSDGVIGNHYWADGFNTTANTGYSQANIAISTWDGDGGTGANGLDSWYVNGEFVGAYDRAALNTSTANLFIGTRVQPQAEGVDGNYAEILVFDKVLSADEINDIGGFLSSKWGVGVPLWTGSLATAMNLVDTDILMTSATAINATTDVTLGNLVVDVPSPVVLTFTGAEELQINLTSTTFSNPLTGAPGLIVDTAPKVNLGPLDMANSNNPVSEKIGTGEWIITDALSNFTGIGSLNVNEGALTLGDTGLLGTTIVNVNAATLKLSSVDTNPDPTYNEAIILTDGTTVLAGMADANSAPAAVVTLPSVINMSGQSLTLGTTDVGYELNIANPVTAGSLNLGGVGTVTFNAGGTVENATVDSSATGTINVPTTLTVTKKLTLKDVPITDNVPMQVVGSNLANPTGTITVSGSAFQIGLPESSIASDGLLGMWTFDGSNGNDTSGNGYNGTAHGPVAYVARNGGMALDLTGGDAAIFVDTGGTQDVFSGYDAMTIGVWAKGSPGNWSPFVSKDENGWQMRRNGGNNNLDWTTRGLTSSDWQVPNSGPAFNGDWHFIVMTYDGAEKKTFIYGDDLAAPIVESIGATGTITNTEDMLVFGARDNDNAAATIGWQTFLNGQLDDIYFYSRALSQAEIEGLYTPVFSTLAPIDMPELNLEMNPGVSSIAVNSTQATLGDLTMGDNTALTVNGTPSISLNDVTVNPAAASINSGGPEIATTVRGTLATAGGTDLTTSIAVNGSLTMGAGSALNAVGADVAAKDFTNNGGTVAFDGASSLTLTSSSLTQNGGSTAFEPTATASGITAIDVQAGSLTTPDTIATETLNVSTGAVLNAAMPVSVSTGATIGDDVVATITGPAFGVSGSDVLAARTLTLNGGSMALTGATIGGSTIPAGIRIWLDASDVNGDGSAAPADGTPIAAWGDKSGYANNATQGAVGDQPVYVA